MLNKVVTGNAALAHPCTSLLFATGKLQLRIYKTRKAYEPFGK